MVLYCLLFLLLSFVLVVVVIVVAVIVVAVVVVVVVFYCCCCCCCCCCGAGCGSFVPLNGSMLGPKFVPVPRSAADTAAPRGAHMSAEQGFSS
jgi:hypothetical protein